MIGDEPEDGPDAYYLLKDFGFAGVINILMEELDVPVNTVFHLNTLSVSTFGSTPATPATKDALQTETEALDISPTSTHASSYISEALDHMRIASDDSHWKNVAWCEVRISDPTDTKDVFDKMAKRIYAVHQMGYLYKSFYSTSSVINVSGSGAGLATAAAAEMRQYKNAFMNIVNERFVTPELILGVLLDNVASATTVTTSSASTASTATSSEIETATATPSVDEKKNIRDNEELQNLFLYFDHAIKRIAINRDNEPAAEKLCTSAEEKRYARYGDDNVLVRLAFDPLATKKISSDQTRLLNSCFGGAFIHQAEGTLSMHSHSLSQMNALASETEYNKVTATSATAVAAITAVRPSLSTFETSMRAMILFEFEDMLNHHQQQQQEEKDIEPKDDTWHLDSWSWTELLDRHTLVQVLQSAKASHPVVVHKYSRQMGKLLVALTNPGAINAAMSDTTHVLKAKSKLNFGMFHCLQEKNPDILNLEGPKTDKGRHYVYKIGDKVVNATDHDKYLYLHDGSMLQVQNRTTVITTPAHDIRCCLSWQQGNTLSWSGIEQSLYGPYFTACLSNGITLSLVQDSASPCDISVNISCADGMLIQFLKHGISQRFIGRGATSPLAAFQVTASGGGGGAYDGTGSGGGGIPEISRTYMWDGCLVRYLTNGDVSVLQPDGTTQFLHKGIWTTTHMDGTRTTSGGKPETTTSTPVMVPSPSPIRIITETYASLHKTIRTREDTVSVTETDKHIIAEHENGVKITSALTGMPRIWMESDDDFRSVKMENNGDGVKVVSVDLGEGSSITQTTAVVESNEDISYVFVFHGGRIQFDSSGKVKLIAKDSGSASFNIDWVEGTTVVEECQDKYTVASDGSVQETTASSTPTPPTQTPNPTQLRNPPKLFIINPDGTGAQLLRDADVLPYIANARDTPSTKIHQERPMDHPDTMAVTVFSEVRNENDRDSEVITIFRQLIQHPPVTDIDRISITKDQLHYSRWQDQKERQSLEQGTYLTKGLTKHEMDTIAKKIWPKSLVKGDGTNRVMESVTSSNGDDGHGIKVKKSIATKPVIGENRKQTEGIIRSQFQM